MNNVNTDLVKFICTQYFIDGISLLFLNTNSSLIQVIFFVRLITLQLEVTVPNRYRTRKTKNTYNFLFQLKLPSLFNKIKRPHYFFSSLRY